MTFLQVLKESFISQKESGLLMAFLLNKEPEYLLTHPETEIDPRFIKKYRLLERKRLAGWSIAVLIGQKEFYGLDFKVDKNVLVPRPETELMVDEILNITKKQSQDLTIIDLGTGSGAIIISCAHELKNINYELYQHTKFLAVDISASALKIAKINSALNQQASKIKFLRGNLLKPIINKRDFNVLAGEIIIAANLPYLTPDQVEASPSIQMEPKLALVAGFDGLKYYHELFAQIKSIKNIFKNDDATLSRLHIFCEIDATQSKGMKILANKFFSDFKIEIKKDLAGKNRLVIISFA